MRPGGISGMLSPMKRAFAIVIVVLLGIGMIATLLPAAFASH